MRGSVIHNLIEGVFKESGIDRAAHHGGELNGMNIQKVMRNAQTIFGKVKDTIIAEVPLDERCSNEEVEGRCDRFMELLILFDGAFSLMQTENEFVPEELIVEIEEYIIAAWAVHEDINRCSKVSCF